MCFINKNVNCYHWPKTWYTLLLQWNLKMSALCNSVCRQNLSHKKATFQIRQENFHAHSVFYFDLRSYILKVTTIADVVRSFHDLKDAVIINCKLNNRLLEISNPFALIFISNKSLQNIIFYWLHARLSFI